MSESTDKPKPVFASSPGSAKSVSKCKHCRKPKGEHKADTEACPVGCKHRLVGYISYSQTERYEPKSQNEKVSHRSASEKRGDRVMTPEWCARDMVEHFRPTGRILEPFRGQGVFTRLLPDAMWCEIDEGKSFFAWSEPVDWIISNPPYSITRECFKHSCRVATDFVYLVPLRNVFSGYGFVREIHNYGGMVEIRIYGTGGKLGFPMGNCVGAIHCRKGYGGDTRWTYYSHSAPHEWRENKKEPTT